MRRWTDKHGADELYDKFVVAKTKDCIPVETYDGIVARPGDYIIPAESRIGEEDDEFIFTLRPETDFAAWTALLVYAGTVRDRYPNLAAAIEEHCDRIKAENEA